MRSVSIHRRVASRHQPLDPSQKPGQRHEGSSRTTTCCRRHTHSQSQWSHARGRPGTTHVLCAHARNPHTHTSVWCGVGMPMGRGNRPRLPPSGWICGTDASLLRAAPLRCSAALLLWQEGKTNLSHDGLNPAHVPCWWVNNPTLPLGCGWEARKSRHRRIKKRRRFERLAATSQLSLW